MYPKRSIFYSALMLTGVHLLLRVIGTSFQIYLSGRIGAEGIGLLQLTLSAGSLAMVAGIAGIRTASMYLTAEELGRGHPENTTWVLSGCLRYSIITGGTAATVLILMAPTIAAHWIADERVRSCLSLFAGFMCVNCLCGVMTGYFTAEGKIGTLAAVEVAEQLFSMVITVLCLWLWAGTDPGRACESVILGSGAGACMTLICLLTLRLRQRNTPGPRIPVASRLASTALPLAFADIIRSGISTAENMLVPKRLALYPGTTRPLATFGILTGMVFPVVMFPACILHGLSDLLIPELARCNAAGNTNRIRYLVSRCLGAALIYGLFFGCMLHLVGENLAEALYNEPEAGRLLRGYALLIPMLYCDALVDAMTKGLGQQRVCVRYNIITSALDVAGLFFLLPQLGMKGYFISFLVTHAINFLLSFNRLILITKIQIPLTEPGKCMVAAFLGLWVCGHAPGPVIRIVGFPTIFLGLLFIFGVLNRDRLRWLKGILHLRFEAK